MSDLQNALLESIGLIAQNSANAIPAVRSIKARVVGVRDAGLGIYDLEYGGNRIEGYSNNLSITYQANDIVYVFIPDGDFTQQKIILGSVASRATSIERTESVSNYNIISDNLLYINYGESGSIGLKSMLDKNDYTITLTNSNFGTLLSNYLNTYKKVKFSAKVKTNIDKDHQTKGNYGLLLTLPFVTTKADGTLENTQVVFNMDVSNMQGNPYAYTQEQQIDIFFDVNDNLTYDVNRNPSLVGFTEGFDYAEVPLDPPVDIWFRDVSFSVVEEIPDEGLNGYYLSIVSNTGRYFLNDGGVETTKSITPLLKLNGKETSTSGWNCYWFVEDSSVKIGDEGYLSFAGMGWKCLNNKTNISYDDTGKQNYQYVVNRYKYDILRSDVVSELTYRCILTQDTVVLSALFRVKDLSKDLKISIVSATGSNTFIKDIGEANLIGRIEYGNNIIADTDIISYEWLRFDQYENYLDNDFYDRVREERSTGLIEQEIKYSCSKIDQSNLIKCTFYREYTNNGTTVKQNLGTASININVREHAGYSITIENSDIIYKYDSDGDSPLAANYDGPVSSRLTGIRPLIFHVYKEDGKELTESEYTRVKFIWSIPKNSMMTLVSPAYTSEDDDYYYVEGHGHQDLNYDIASVFSKSKENNIILLNIGFDNKTILGRTATKFLKDGESGTNGSRYTAIITHGGNAYCQRDTLGRVRKVIMVWDATEGRQHWYYYDIVNKRMLSQYPSFGISVYKDGNQINQSGIYTVEWSMFDPGDNSKTNKVCFGINSGGVLSATAQWLDSSVVYTNVVKAKITINPQNITEQNDENTQVIFAYYPIEIVRVAAGIIENDQADVILPCLNNGFSEVLYSSDGQNPSWDSSTPFVFTNTIGENDNHIYSYQWIVDSDNKNLIINEGATSVSPKIVPVNNFNSCSSKNYVKVIASMSSAQSSEAESKKSTLDTEIETLQAEEDRLNGDKTYLTGSQHLVDKLENKGYNYYIGLLKEAQTLLLYRKQDINYIENLKELVQEIFDYCDSIQISVEDFPWRTFKTNADTRLNSAYSSLYNLLTNGDYISLDDFNDFKDELIIDITIQTNYGLSVYNQLLIYKEQWDRLIDKYVASYNNLILCNLSKLQDATDELISFFNEDPDYLGLTTNSEQHSADQEYINLSNAVTAVLNRLSDDQYGKIDSYYDYDNGILKSLHNLFVVYMDKDYQNSKYDTRISAITKQITEKQTTKSVYEEGLTTEVESGQPAQEIAIIIRPIVMMFNRYGLSHLNGWDGNKLYTGDNDSFLFAPQVGAGKMSNNKFTGIAIGVRDFSSGTDKDIGLFGYSDGVQSIFLDAETGSAYFGTSGTGQIQLLPKNGQGIIRSGNYDPDNPTAGMNINLTNGVVHFGSSVGKIYSGAHTSLTSDAQGFYLSHDGMSIGDKFYVESGANGAKLRLGYGASTGIGNHWEVNGNATNSYIAFGSNKTLAMNWSNKTIGGADGQVYIGTDGIRLGNDFAVNNNGQLIAKDIYAEGTVESSDIIGSRVTGSEIYLVNEENNNLVTYGFLNKKGLFLFRPCAEGTEGAQSLTRHDPGHEDETLYYNTELNMSFQQFKEDSTTPHGTGWTMEDRTNNSFSQLRAQNFSISQIYNKDWTVKDDEYVDIGSFDGYKAWLSMNPRWFGMYHKEDSDTNSQKYDYRLGHFLGEDVTDTVALIDQWWSADANPNNPDEAMFIMQSPSEGNQNFSMMVYDQLVMAGGKYTSKMSPKAFRVRNKLDPDGINTLIRDHFITIDDRFYKKSPFRINGTPMYRLTNTDNIIPGDNGTDLADGCFIVVYDGPDREEETVNITILGGLNDVITITDLDNNEITKVYFSTGMSRGSYQGTLLKRHGDYKFISQVNAVTTVAELIAPVMTVDCTVSVGTGNWELLLIYNDDKEWTGVSPRRQGKYNSTVVINDVFGTEFVDDRDSKSGFTTALYGRTSNTRNVYANKNDIYLHYTDTSYSDMSSATLNKNDIIPGETTHEHCYSGQMGIKIASLSPISGCLPYDQISVFARQTTNGTTTDSTPYSYTITNYGTSRGGSGSTSQGNYITVGYENIDGEFVGYIEKRPTTFEGEVRVLTFSQGGHEWTTYHLEDMSSRIRIRNKPFAALVKVPANVCELTFYDPRQTSECHFTVEMPQGIIRSTLGGGYIEGSYINSSCDYDSGVQSYYLSISAKREVYGIALYHDTSGVPKMTRVHLLTGDTYKVINEAGGSNTSSSIGFLAKISSSDDILPDEIGMIGQYYNSNCYGFFYNKKAGLSNSPAHGEYFDNNGSRGLRIPNQQTGRVFWYQNNNCYIRDLHQETVSGGFGVYCAAFYDDPTAWRTIPVGTYEFTSGSLSGEIREMALHMAYPPELYGMAQVVLTDGYSSHDSDDVYVFYFTEGNSYEGKKYYHYKDGQLAEQALSSWATITSTAGNIYSYAYIDPCRYAALEGGPTDSWDWSRVSSNIVNIKDPTLPSPHQLSDIAKVAIDYLETH